jgi:two-component system, sensor histidine kinase and response regulator
MSNQPLFFGKPVHILVVEDSPTQAQQLVHILERQGCQVTCAENGRKALDFIRTSHPTLIITDIVMPEMDGYELCRQVKADPALSDIPVILVTTLSDPYDVIRGLECRADNFIVKPFDNQYLMARIHFVLVNYEMRKHEKLHGEMGIEINFNGQRHFITADRLQILNLLLSTYETAIQRNQELSRTKDDLRSANDSLRSSNKELEAFSYSVSHDLRAPLRSISGFVRILAEDYAPKLDATANDLINRVITSCDRMGQIIDDLLRLSQLTHHQMIKEPVDLTLLAESITADLRQLHPERTVHIDFQPGIIAHCDMSLMRVALVNLLGNAWKFTSKQPRATIEFGIAIEGDETIYFIRDNGAGFDMAHAAQLFGAFNRLHRASDFPGTGIGLAIVQRIVHRHSGRIWAEASPNNGATFYFTLQARS